jgi:nitrogen regulatory protein P-II 1
MKLITAIMRPEQLDELIDVVVDSGAHGLTVTEVRGFGQQFGQLVASRGHANSASAGRAADRRAALLTKIAKHARSEKIGDGKIWITPVDGAIRVRTGARDRDAV